MKVLSNFILNALFFFFLREIKCVRMCFSPCMCVFTLLWLASCQCVALSPAQAKPNYRRTATDLAGMLTITGEAEGRGSLGKVTAGLELCRSGPQGHGKEGGEGVGGVTTISASAAALIIYHSRSFCKHEETCNWINTTPVSPTPHIPPFEAQCPKCQTVPVHNCVWPLHLYAPAWGLTVIATHLSLTICTPRVTQKAHVSLQEGRFLSCLTCIKRQKVFPGCQLGTLHTEVCVHVQEGHVS